MNELQAESTLLRSNLSSASSTIDTESLKNLTGLADKSFGCLTLGSKTTILLESNQASWPQMESTGSSLLAEVHAPVGSDLLWAELGLSDEDDDRRRLAAEFALYTALSDFPN
jgi:hypothetical protein